MVLVIFITTVGLNHTVTVIDWYFLSLSLSQYMDYTHTLYGHFFMTCLPNWFWHHPELEISTARQSCCGLHKHHCVSSPPVRLHLYPDVIMIMHPSSVDRILHKQLEEHDRVFSMATTIPGSLSK